MRIRGRGKNKNASTAKKSNRNGVNECSEAETDLALALRQTGVKQ